MTRQPKPNGQNTKRRSFEDGKRLANAAANHPACTGQRPGKGDHHMIYGKSGSRPVPIPQRKLSSREQAQICRQLSLAGIIFRCFVAVLTSGTFLTMIAYAIANIK